MLISSPQAATMKMPADQCNIAAELVPFSRWLFKIDIVKERLIQLSAAL